MVALRGDGLRKHTLTPQCVSSHKLADKGSLNFGKISEVWAIGNENLRLDCSWWRHYRCSPCL